MIYSGGDLPARVRQRHPELVALRKLALPGRIVAERMSAMPAIAQCWSGRAGSAAAELPDL